LLSGGHEFAAGTAEAVAMDAVIALRKQHFPRHIQFVAQPEEPLGLRMRV
jgi:hypothetical protein